MIWTIIKNRLGEASTWKGLLSAAAGVGLQLSGVQIDLIAVAMVSIYAALSALLPDTFGK
jgi:hypothetical protein